MRETAAEGMATVRHVAFRELDARTGSYAVVLTTDQRIVVIELPRRAADWGDVAARPGGGRVSPDLVSAVRSMRDIVAAVAWVCDDRSAERVTFIVEARGHAEEAERLWRSRDEQEAWSREPARGLLG